MICMPQYTDAASSFLWPHILETKNLQLIFCINCFNWIYSLQINETHQMWHGMEKVCCSATKWSRNAVDRRQWMEATLIIPSICNINIGNKYSMKSIIRGINELSCKQLLSWKCVWILKYASLEWNYLYGHMFSATLIGWVIQDFNNTLNNS